MDRKYIQGKLCPECNSETLQKFGTSIVRRVKAQRYVCHACNRITHNPIEKENK